MKVLIHFKRETQIPQLELDDVKDAKRPHAACTFWGFQNGTENFWINADVIAMIVSKEE